MFRLDVLQNQWLIFTLVGGAGVLLATILLFVALWRPRGEAQRSFMPWLIILLIGGYLLFMAVYLARVMTRMPNW